MTIVNRRNAVIGWGVWKLGKRVVKPRAAARTKSLIAVGIASAAGALTFWRRHRSDAESS